MRNASGETLDLKPYEADMRHLLDTYIEADEPRKISPFDNVSLLDLIVKTGIADAIAQRLNTLKGNQSAIAETIENNVRSKIIKEHLNDPAFYDKMSAQLQELIELRKAKAIEYEDYLKKIAELAKQTVAGQGDDLPAPLDTPGKRALYHNLKAVAATPVANAVGDPRSAYATSDDSALNLTLRIDQAIRNTRPDDWRGVPSRERIVKGALYGVLRDASEVERLFPIVKAQADY
ncbi:MAG: hypothetical protein IPN66_17445 [Candidatus Competibacteraceae bacterium]|nr:hypothetical protein [Candidatus Competibacteraceae bacterium]MBK7982504.1 hypothetical protein [Candidatus Competibacteraceae bacterium]MBK8898946.1 hypothetical protein [Candidatus Competibacteraceae bacterium]MBK8963906.1 hypothetical protein [Candidatus Competibacteraceae bacterium]